MKESNQRKAGSRRLPAVDSHIQVAEKKESEEEKSEDSTEKKEEENTVEEKSEEDNEKAWMELAGYPISNLMSGL